MNATVSQISSERRAEERPIMLMMPLFMSLPVAPRRIDGQLRLHLDHAGEGGGGVGSLAASDGAGRRDGSDCRKKMTFKEIYAERV